MNASVSFDFSPAVERVLKDLTDPQTDAIMKLADNLKINDRGDLENTRGRKEFNAVKEHSTLLNTYGVKSDFGYAVSLPLFIDMLTQLVRKKFDTMEKAARQSDGTVPNSTPFRPRQDWETWTISDKDRAFLAPFRHAVDENGRPKLYAKCGDPDTEVYRPVGIPVGSLVAQEVLSLQLASILDDKHGNLFHALREAYEDELAGLETILDTSPEKVQSALFGVEVMVVFVQDDNGKPIPHYEMQAKSFVDYMREILPVLLKDQDLLIDEPKIITNDPAVPGFFYFDKAAIASAVGETPTWDGWMLAMPDYCRPVFMAWVYSIFDPENMGRQALWLKGEGFNGKSVVGNVLCDYIGRAAYSLSKGAMENQFAYSFVYGKRFISYGDCKNNRLISTERLHSILGGDRVSIEEKGIQPFSGYVHAKVYIAANIDPEIDSQYLNELTRIIYIPLGEPPPEVLAAYCKTDSGGKVERDAAGNPVMLGNSDFHPNLTAEIPAFLNKCREHYTDLCPNRQQLVLPDIMLDSIRTNCVDPQTIEFDEFVSDYLEIGDGLEIIAGDLQSLFKDEMNTKDNHVFNDFRRFLEVSYGVTRADWMRDTDGKRVKRLHYRGCQKKPISGTI